MERFNLVGQRFGRLLVLRDVGTHPRSRKSQWEAVCDCGAQKVFLGTRLTSGQTKSCGCLLKDRLRELKSLPSGIAAKNQVWRRYQKDAVRRNLPWNLSFEDFHCLTGNPCHYCDALPSNEFGWRNDASYNGTFVYNGIDRKDNSKGYTLDNVVSACNTCNKAKRTMTYDQFIAWLIRAGQKQMQERNR
jgi:hypothetical protein